MVEARTLSIDGNIVKILCIPSGNENEAFELTIDIENNIILDNIKNNQHAVHAAYKMFEIYNNTGAIPDSCVSAWC